MSRRSSVERAMQRANGLPDERAAQRDDWQNGYDGTRYMAVTYGADGNDVPPHWDLPAPHAPQSVSLGGDVERERYAAEPQLTVAQQIEAMLSKHR